MINCRHCHRDLPESEFYSSDLKKNCRLCKECSKEKSKVYYQKNKKRIQESHTKYRKTHKELFRKLLQNYRERVRQSQVDYETAVMSMTDGYTIRILNYAKNGEYKYSVDGNGKHFVTNDVKEFKNYIDKEAIF